MSFLQSRAIRKTRNSFLIILLIAPSWLKAQDTIDIRGIKLTTYLSRQTLLRTTTAAAVIDSARLKLLSETSLVNSINTVPGLRMEERSPGSYRLSIRGSLLRSPFGVRNVKVYMDAYPLTDAGGNTYINVLAMNAINAIEILKGPDGSLFGANSGGVVTINTEHNKNGFSAGLSAGSYGLFKEDAAMSGQVGKHFLNVAESYQRSDGYRQNSRLHRLYVHMNDQWHYSTKNTLKVLLFASNLFYQTPGGLTQLQYDTNARQSRPATPVLPAAASQKAAVYNNMFFAGITHVAVINKNIEHVAAVFGSTVDFKNPFITNYETRKENTYGLRTFLSLKNDQTTSTRLKLEYDLGIEWQQTKASINNYQNNLGSKGAIIASGNVLSDQHFIFNKLQFDIHKKLLIEAGLSLNYYRYHFKDSFALNKKFDPQWMPRLALSYTASKKLTLRSSAGRGYSPPTTAEVRPSDNKIYSQLQAETGINIELGLRYTAFANKLWIDIAAYNYKLHNAIVRQLDSAGNDFFTNAGGTMQNGLEMQVNYIPVSNTHTLVKKLQLSNSSTLNDFTFKDYIIGTNNYSANRITGVPKACIVSSLLMELKTGTYLFILHNYTSSIPLNDANSFFSKPYNLIQLKLGHVFSLKHGRLELYAMVDNLLNKKYSLGNDLNAVGNRFFNAAALRNYVAGIILSK